MMPVVDHISSPFFWQPTPKRQYIRKKPMPKKPSIEDMPSTSSLAHSLGPYDFKSQFTSTLNQSAPATVLSAMKQEGLGKRKASFLFCFFMARGRLMLKWRRKADLCLSGGWMGGVGCLWGCRDVPRNI